jgi:hypothetical protein
MKIPRLCKSGVAPNSVDRNAKKRCSVLLKLRQNFIIKSHLVAADRTPISRVEGQNQRFSA